MPTIHRMKDTELFIAGVIRHTDKETLLALCERMHIAYKERGAKSLEISGRRFFFGANGDILKIVDYGTDMTSDEKGTRQALLPPARQEHAL